MAEKLTLVGDWFDGFTIRDQPESPLLDDLLECTTPGPCDDAVAHIMRTYEIEFLGYDGLEATKPELRRAAHETGGGKHR